MRAQALPFLCERCRKGPTEASMTGTNNTFISQTLGRWAGWGVEDTGAQLYTVTISSPPPTPGFSLDCNAFEVNRQPEVSAGGP